MHVFAQYIKLPRNQNLESTRKLRAIKIGDKIRLNVKWKEKIKKSTDISQKNHYKPLQTAYVWPGNMSAYNGELFCSL